MQNYNSFFQFFITASGTESYLLLILTDFAYNSCRVAGASRDRITIGLLLPKVSSLVKPAARRFCGQKGVPGSVSATMTRCQSCGPKGHKSIAQALARFPSKIRPEGAAELLYRFLSAPD
jgi:hypothetical protein